MRRSNRTRLHRAAAAALLALGSALAAAGCYSPAIDDGTLSCASANRCPRGFVCREPQKVCYRAGADAAISDLRPGAEPDGAVRERDGDAAVADVADSPPDIVGDVADGASDMAPDAAPDIAVDRAPDVAPDIAADRAADIAPDAAPDIGVDRAPDVAPDIAADIAPDVPAPKGIGSLCAQPSECASLHCVDGVCCDQVCGEQCKACDVGPSPGTCVQVTSGPPHGTRARCAGSGTCAGTCSAASPTACTYPGGDVTCHAATCSGGTFSARAGCDGAGSCSTPATMSCGDLTCNASGTACLSACTADNQCANPARPYCDGGACVSGRANGARCQAAGECASRQCVDGFCCNAACQLPCQACDVAGHAGMCTPVPNGTPYGGRTACDGTGDCMGTCNNLSSGQCFYPGSDRSCPCPGGLTSGTCNGAGHCQTIVQICL